jgi:8-oxo-dGTP pyrophosphatase MutT (NUDIX family)
VATDFEERLTKALKARPGRETTIEGTRDAAVLIPIVAEPEPTLIFTLRTDTLPSHKGQISFPGGRIDPGDESPVAAALRESHEEIALDPNAVRVLGTLDDIETFVSDYVVTPVIGWIDTQPELKPNPAEVAQVLHIPLSGLTEETRTEPGFNHEGRFLPTEAWVHEGNVIWGVTARILRLFLWRLADAGLADPPADTASPWPSTSPPQQ